MRCALLFLFVLMVPSLAPAQLRDDDDDGEHTVIARTTWEPDFIGFDGEVAYDVASVFCNRPPLTFAPPHKLPKPCGLPRAMNGVEVAGDVAESIVIHHSDFGDAPGPVVIRDYHLQVAGFSDIGYHFVIAADGRIYEGRPIHLLGAHAGISAEGRADKSKDPDFHAVGIVLDGNSGVDPPPRVQIQSLQWLVHALRERYDISAGRIYGHRDVKSQLVEARGLHLDSSPTTCPGDGAYPLVAAIRARELLR